VHPVTETAGVRRVKYRTPLMGIYHGKTADERRAARRLRLVEAAIELFGTQGFRATSARAVLRQASAHRRLPAVGQRMRIRQAWHRGIPGDQVDDPVRPVVDGGRKGRRTARESSGASREKPSASERNAA
jgi:hypothetical protein